MDMRIGIVSEQLFFSIGCFNLGIKKAAPFKITGKDYIGEVKRTLESIANIDKVHIEADIYFEEIIVDAEKDLPTVSEAFGFFPPPGSMLGIEFEIYIPERLQKELSPMGFFHLGSERFKVYLHDSYFFPVSFIEVISPSGDTCDPSDAVVLVREFLKKQFEKTDSELLRFEFLGPSPFHADFYLQASTSREDGTDKFDSEGFRAARISSMGYDVYNFTYDSSRYENLKDAASRLFFLLAEEAGLFYRMESLEVQQMDKWQFLQEKVGELLALQKERRLGIARIGLGRNYRRIYDVVTAIADFETGEIWAQYFCKREYQAVQLNGKQPYLDTYLKQQIESLPIYPTRQIRDIVELLESRRSQVIENTIIIIAAIAGGIAGSLITILITKP